MTGHAASWAAPEWASSAIAAVAGSTSSGGAVRVDLGEVAAAARKMGITPGGLSGKARGNRLMRMLQASYDAAKTDEQNRRHWAAADLLSANAANSVPVRQILRSRARYEVANNSYARGIVNTLANYIVGTGPRLQMLGSKPEENRRVEREFARWAAAVQLAEKLWTMRVAQATDGEAFGTLATNESLPTRVKLDVRLFEADQVSTPTMVFDSYTDPFQVDGIRLDRSGNPVEYHVLRWHPGDTRAPGASFNRVPTETTDRSGNSSARFGLDYDVVPAASMLHLYRPERAGQVRGVPEIMPALPLFNMLRRYTIAVLIAAENAALIGGLIHTGQSPEETEEVEPLDLFDYDPGTWMTLPEGWLATQLRAEQPVQTYKEFKGEVLAEVARCLNMPYILAAGNSSGANYSSGRLDHQAFSRFVTIDQTRLEGRVLDRVLGAWFDEASLISGYLPQEFRAIDRPSHAWFWDGLEHVDPAKEATAAQTRIATGKSNLAIECAKDGQDWEEVMRQRARELELQRELGIPEAAAAAAPAGAPAGRRGADDDEEGEA